MGKWADLRRKWNEADATTLEEGRRAWEWSNRTFDSVTFKSRAERRAALLLSSLGIVWEYESATYALPNGERYIPDFYLPEVGQFIEVKSGTKAERLHKPSMFARSLIAETPHGQEPLRVAILWDSKLFDAWCENGFWGPTDNDPWCEHATWNQCKSCSHWYAHDMCRGGVCRACGASADYETYPHEYLWALVHAVEGSEFEQGVHSMQSLFMAVAQVLNENQRHVQSGAHRPNAALILGHPTIPYHLIKKAGRN